jgi:hypothetical protein
MSDLKELFNKYGCDKAIKHNYHTIYEKYMAPRREDHINILEVGVFKGNSIEAWLDYFPNATIYGIDIFVRVKPENITVLNHNRVKWARGDSTKSADIMALWPDVKFDFIIDDGLHTPAANKDTFDNLIGKLAEGGKFFIEDVFPIDCMSSSEMMIPWIVNRSKDYNVEKFAEFMKSINEYKHDRYDNRKLTMNPDSYMFVVHE